MELSRLRHRPILDAAGVRLGRVEDIAVRLSDPHPCVSAVIMRTGRAQPIAVDTSALARLSEAQVELAAPGTPPGRPLADDELLLVRDVLDTQVFDMVGRRMSRVGDITLAPIEGSVSAVGVTLGLAPIARRLGLGWLARRAVPIVDWRSIHLASRRGHTLQVDATAQRLAPRDIAELAGRLPAEHGAELLGALAPDAAASALGHAHPPVGGRLLSALHRDRAAAVVAAMPMDDATAALRHLSPARRDALLSGLDTARARELRVLLRHPPATAAGLMNPSVLSAPETEPVSAIRERVSRLSPELDALLTVFVVDQAERPVGAYPPRLLLRADPNAAPIPSTPMPATAPITEVIDRFALSDELAVPVVDADGRLIGVIAVDDVFEELLAAKLPGRRRFRFRRGRA